MIDHALIAYLEDEGRVTFKVECMVQHLTIAERPCRLWANDYDDGNDDDDLILLLLRLPLLPPPQQPPPPALLLLLLLLLGPL